MGVLDLFDLKGKVSIVTGGGRGLGLAMAEGLAEAVPPPAAAGKLKRSGRNGDEAKEMKKGELSKINGEIDLSNVQARKNLNETALFYPHLTCDDKGIVTIAFKMPEALTEWRFIGFAHTENMEYGGIEGRTITRKDLMVQPNPPRSRRRWVSRSVRFARWHK